MIQYYVTYEHVDGSIWYYTGTTFFKESQWSEDINHSHLFNHQLAPFEINDIIVTTKLEEWFDQIKKENMKIHKIKITEYKTLQSNELSE